MHSENPILGVGVCGLCERSLAQQFTKNKTNETVHRYYRCSRTPRNCNGIFMVADDVDTVLEQTFLEKCGSLPVTRRVFQPGEDHTEELDVVKASIARLQRESDMGLISTSEDEALYLSRMSGLIKRRDDLAALPQRAAGWTHQPTGKTYIEAWQSAEAKERRKMLVDAGVHFIIHGKHKFEVKIPEDIQDRLKQPKTTGL